MGNQNFYRGHTGPSIMTAANFSPEIRHYLRSEIVCCTSTPLASDYRVLVEFGCSDMRLQPCADAAGLSYLGVDLRSEVGLSNRHFLAAHEHVRNSRFIGVDAERLVHRLSAYKRLSGPFGRAPGRALVFLPFNFLGNLRQPCKLIQSIFLLGHDLVVSQFATTPTARKVRAAYYSACGLNVELCIADFGDVYTDEWSFSSTSFRSKWINETIKGLAGYRMLFSELRSCDLFSIVLIQAKLDVSEF